MLIGIVHTWTGFWRWCHSLNFIGCPARTSFIPPPVCNLAHLPFVTLDLLLFVTWICDQKHFHISCFGFPTIFVILQHAATVKRPFEQVKGTTGSHCTMCKLWKQIKKWSTLKKKIPPIFNENLPNFEGWCINIQKIQKIIDFSNILSFFNPI